MNPVSQALRPWTERLRRGWRGSPLPAFFAWWGGELAALVPPRWRVRFGGGADWYLLQFDGAMWRLHRASAPAVLAQWTADANADMRRSLLTDALRHVDREDLRLAVLLPPALALRRAIALPLAARDTLRQVAAFEMDRQTPFALPQVHYDVRETAGPAPAGRFAAELLVVTRQALDPLLAECGALGVPVDAVDLPEAGGRAGFNLLAPEQSPRHVRPRLRLNLALGAASVILLVLSLHQWLHNRETALAQMQERVESMRGGAQQVAALRQQLQDNMGAAGFLAQRKKNTITMLGLLADITARLPDSAWLERFNVDNTGQVGLQGESKQAAMLLDVLKNSTLIRDASFQGSIQPDPATGKERFYMVAQLREPAGAKPSAATDAGTP